MAWSGSRDDWIDLARYADLQNFITVGSLLYPNSEAAAEKAYQQLKDQERCFHRLSPPARARSFALRQQCPREGDPVDRGQRTLCHSRPGPTAEDHPPEPGVHGYDPRAMTSMRALFLAVGPDIRPGSKLEPFENVNVYSLHRKNPGFGCPQSRWQSERALKILKNNPVDD